ncbi:MAG: UDP-N-acetylglucosamine 2-epimerase [bacterium]|nr:UDP-N-acetylglucosamine 2-epimerase [bacterium]
MKTNKIHIIIGTKAQLIKMAPVMVEMQKRSIPYNFVFTGQHQETIDQLRSNFGVKTPDITLHKGKDITKIPQMFFWILKILFKKPSFIAKNDLILVHGDTFSTLLGAIMGKRAKAKVAHIESGLKSDKLLHPFPEEITRRMTFRLSDYYFCPGKWAVNNLNKHKGKKINTLQNTLYDSLELILKQNSTVDIPPEPYCICSIHRFENIFNKKRLKEIIEILNNTAKTMKMLFIMHPPTKSQLEKWDIKLPNIELRPRYDYKDFIQLLNNSQFIITDGGSNQEEAFYLGKPCILLRKTTERKEGLDKNVVISKYNPKTIKEFTENYNYERYKCNRLKTQHSPSRIIVNELIKLTK